MSGVDTIRCEACYSGMAADAIEKWHSSGGVLHYIASSHERTAPECDAMFIVECPLLHQELLRISSFSKKECVVYRPPTWQLHAETAATRFAMSDDLALLFSTLRTFIGRDDLRPRHIAAMEYAKYDPAITAVFTYKEVFDLIGFNTKKQVRLLSRWAKWSKCSYDFYMPQIEPEDAEWLAMFRVLEEEPEFCNGLRLLRNGELGRIHLPESYQPKRVRGFKQILRKMVKERYVTQYPSINLLQFKPRDPDDEMFDAISGVRLKQVKRMCDFVDGLPEYPI